MSLNLIPRNSCKSCSRLVHREKTSVENEKILNYCLQGQNPVFRNCTQNNNNNYTQNTKQGLFIPIKYLSTIACSNIPMNTVYISLLTVTESNTLNSSKSQKKPFSKQKLSFTADRIHSITKN